MSNIKQLKVDDSNIYPITHEDAVLDNNGVSISAKYATKESVNTQMTEVGRLLNDLQTTITTANDAVGDLNQLQTSNKSSIVAALNEAFQYGNSVKQSLVDALIAKEVNVSTSSSMSQLIAKIADIEQGGATPDFTIPGLPPWHAGTNVATENFWAKGTDMTATRHAAVGGAIGDNVYVCGGLSNTSTNNANHYQKTNYCYNTKTNEWSTKTSMTVAKYEATAAVADNKLYVIGGDSGNNARTATVHSYDPSTNSWTERAAMPVSLRALSATTANNQIYVFGGYNASNAAVANVYCYDIAGNSWSEKASMPAANYGNASTLYNNEIYVMGGVAKNTNYCYDIAANSFTSKTVVPANVANHSLATIRNQIYLVGGGTGTSGTSASNVVHCYNPSANTWVTKANLPASIYNHVGAKVRNNIFVASGRSGNSLLKTTYCYVPESNK